MKSFLRVSRLWLSSAATSSTESPTSLKEQVQKQIEKESRAKSRIACYPHRSLTRPVLPLEKSHINTPLFTSRLLDLISTAKDLGCISFSAPKAHWDAAVLLLRRSPDDADFEVWVNPEVPGYHAKDSVAPMYGMWENCVSCGACNAWVIRPQKIVCHGFDMYGNEKHETLDGIAARCLMHELDHLNGKTILHQAQGPEFVVSSAALGQRDLWPANFPSAEAYMTAPNQFFDFVTNTTVVPGGLEWWFAQHMAQFNSTRLGQ